MGPILGSNKTDMKGASKGKHRKVDSKVAEAI